MIRCLCNSVCPAACRTCMPPPRFISNICPTPAPCPPCPPPVVPDVVCTPALEAFASQLMQTPATAVNIPNAFNTNDGPAPYTVTSVAFMNLQLPLTQLSFAPSGNNNYLLSSVILPMVHVSCLDGTGTQRTKFLQASLPLTGTVALTENPNVISWWAFMESGSISNPVLAGNVLSFSAMASISIIGTADMPQNYPVVQNHTCAQPVPHTACRNLFELQSYCQISYIIPSSSPLIIPFTPLGTRPYSNPSAFTLGGTPYVLRVEQISNLTLIDLAFPITLHYSDAGTTLQTQSTFLYMTLTVLGVANEPDTRIIADLTIENIQLVSGTFTGTVLTPFSVFLSGSIIAIGDSSAVLTADAVQCGNISVPTCPLVFTPPTAE